MLITGSLGSGKTTLLRRLLDSADGRIAVLMNEFGEIAIDSKIVKGDDIEIVELAGGCVCCSLTGEFEAAVREIVEKIDPEYILVEATGVAEADALVYEIEDNLPEVRLDCVVCIVDAFMSIRFPHIGYTTRTHLETADIALINKVDLVTEEEVRQVERQIRNYNDSAAISRAVRCDVDTRLLVGGETRKRSGQHDHESQFEVESFAYSSEAKLNEAHFRRLVDQLPPTVYRSKGFVRFENGSYLFNFVVGRADFEEFPSEKTELVFIGRHLDAIKNDIMNRLHECEV